MFNPEAPPEFTAERWLNVNEPLSLAALKGRVVAVCAFHMGCKGSMQHGLPQALRLAKGFDPSQVVVAGLATSGSGADTNDADGLDAYVAQNHFGFPIAVDKPSEDGGSQTMTAYEMQGTPTILLFDRQGRLRRHYLGEADDIRLSAEIMGLAIEHAQAPRETSIAIETMLGAALTDPGGHHHHDHDGECCGGHDHSHEHENDHAHRDGAGCGDPACGCSD